MSNPLIYSVDIPNRGQQLIDKFWSTVSEKKGTALPLNATFLLAISTPMVNLPIERVWKPVKGHAVGHLNDAVLDARLATWIRNGIGPDVVSKAEFYRPDAWSYHYLPKGAGFPNLSQTGLPQVVENALGTAAGRSAAAGISTQTFCGILRNALAHGGVLYLDKDGCSTHGKPVRMFCFVSTEQNRNAKALHFLRIGMRDYREFLKLWTKWLHLSSLPTTATPKTP